MSATTTPTSSRPAYRPRAAAQIGLGVTVKVLAISCSFATGAAFPSITIAHHLTSTERTLLLIIVQSGFAAGAIAVGLPRLAGRIGPAFLIPVGSVLTALVTVLPLIAPGNMTVLLLSRILVGVGLAGVCPTGMRATFS